MLEKIKGLPQLIFEKLSEQLSNIFYFRDLSVYNLQQNETEKKGFILQNIYGKGG